MAEVRYPALLHKDATSAYGVSFPDFPGVVTAGATLGEARALAQEALTFHIEGLMADGAAIPDPSSLEEVMIDPANRDGVAILVTVAETETVHLMRSPANAARLDEAIADIEAGRAFKRDD
jgi:predicted RNase H-like HicB family nuclease